MRAVLPDDEDRPRLAEVPDPEPAAGEVLVEVEATALNRVDLMQIQGRYPPPPGESEIPGLECAGRIVAAGAAVSGRRVGERVMALLGGGGHAERVAVPEGQLMTLPESLSYEEGAALPEVALTAWTNLVAEGGLKADETVLVSGAASGVGSFAVQLAKALGARVLVSGRNRPRLEALVPLGADACITLGESLPAEVRELTSGRGVDLVLELVGGPHLPRSLVSLAPRGRLVLVGLMAGARASIDLGAVLRRRLHLVGSVLRSRPRAEKARLVSSFWAFAEPLIASGRLAPVIDSVYPFARIAEAYEALRRGGVFGKVVVRVDGAGSRAR